MKKLVCLILMVLMLFSVASASLINETTDGVHIASFAERYYTRLKILQDYAKAEFSLLGNSYRNGDYSQSILYLDDLLYSINEKGIITNLSFSVDTSIFKQFSAVASIKENTVNDMMCLAFGQINDTFFTEYASGLLSDLMSATMKEYCIVGDYVGFYDQGSIRFYLKSEYPL